MSEEVESRRLLVLLGFDVVEVDVVRGFLVALINDMYISQPINPSFHKEGNGCRLEERTFATYSSVTERQTQQSGHSAALNSMMTREQCLLVSLSLPFLLVLCFSMSVARISRRGEKINRCVPCRKLRCP